jgi:hypothetical protein
LLPPTVLKFSMRLIRCQRLHHYAWLPVTFLKLTVELEPARSRRCHYRYFVFMVGANLSLLIVIRGCSAFRGSSSQFHDTSYSVTHLNIHVQFLSSRRHFITTLFPIFSRQANLKVSGYDRHPIMVLQHHQFHGSSPRFCDRRVARSLI